MLNSLFKSVYLTNVLITYQKKYFFANILPTFFTLFLYLK